MIIKNLLYILQQENYQIKPFLRFAYSHFQWWRFEQRSQLTWTAKAKTVYIAAYLLILLKIIAILLLSFSPWWLILILPALPLFISIAVLILQPVDQFLKKRMLQKAKAILKSAGRHLVVIGITGSYGKTSTREILAAVLSAKYKVFTSPDNINTDLGLAQLIINRQNDLSNYDIFVVEMGAYRKGEIETICDLVEPDYSILTGINESHLERFGSIDNTISAKFELPVATKKASVLNGANRLIRDNFQKFPISQPMLAEQSEITDLIFSPDFQGFSFVYQGVKFETGLLAAHNLELILPCLIIAKMLGIAPDDCITAVKSLQPVPHRLQLIRNRQANLNIIDDSYNGNIDGFRSGLEVLSRASGRKIVLTPGLVEQGEREQAIHEQIGEMYAQLPADLVLLIQNKCTTFIINGLNKHNFSNYRIYPSTQAAHADLGNVLKAGDTIIFQNDWPDNYF